MKLSKIIKKGIMMVLFVFLSLNFPNTHVNVQASVEAKEVIEQQLFGKDGKTSIDVSQYQLNKTETKQIVTELQKDYGTIGLMECTYQTDESGSVQTIKVQTDESLKSVISEINEIEEKTDADDSQEKLKQQVISDYVELQKYYEANPDYFGVAVPHFADKDTEETPLGAIIELAELDDQFSGVSLDAEDMGDAMQIRDGDDDAMDLDADSEEDVSLDDEALDDALGLSDELGADFDDEE